MNNEFFNNYYYCCLYFLYILTDKFITHIKPVNILPMNKLIYYIIMPNNVTVIKIIIEFKYKYFKIWN